MRLKYIFIYLFMISNLSMSYAKIDGEVLISDFSEKLYYPQDNGVKDLFVEIEIPSITRQLNEKLVFGKLKRVFFCLYWKAPGVVDVQVKGLPEGYYQIKNNLRYMVVARLDLILPKKFKDNFIDYDLSGVKLGEGSQVTAIDLTNIKLVRKYQIDFNNKGVLKKLIADGDGLNRSTFSFVKACLKCEKLILRHNNVVSEKSDKKTIIKNQITYRKFGNYIFPSLLTSDIDQVMSKKSGRGSIGQYLRKFKTVVLFKNYSINNSVASKWFKKNKPMVLSN